jgi:hypothetical protein
VVRVIHLQQHQAKVTLAAVVLQILVQNLLPVAEVAVQAKLVIQMEPLTAGMVRQIVLLELL